METPLGSFRIFDAHAHFFSRRFFETYLELARHRLEGPDPAQEMARLLGWEIPGPDPVDLARRWIEDMDSKGVDRMVMIASIPGDEDSVAAAVAAYPARFLGYFLIDPTEPDASDRVRRNLGRPGMRGVCIFPAMHRISPDDPRLEAIYEEAASRKALVFVHCGLLKVGIRDKLGLPSPFDLRLGNPLAVQAVAARHARTRFVIPHFGCGMWRETLLAGSACKNIHVDTSSSNDWMKTHPEPINLPRVLARTIGALGVERVLFGTDSSFLPRGFRSDILEAQLRAMIDLGLSREVVQAVLGGNIERILGEG
jgi:hypothetical protein